MRNPVLVRISPLRSEQLYRIGPGGEVYNRFRVSVANRSRTPAAVDVSVEGLGGARLTLPSDAIALEPGAAQELEFEVAARPGDIRPGVNHFRFVARSGADKLEDRIEMTFIAPERP
jgi:hypothetical protein